MALLVTREELPRSRRIYIFARKSIDFPLCCLLAVCKTRVRGQSGSLTVRSCGNWRCRTISRPRRRDRGSCRAPGRTRSPSCKRYVKQKLRVMHNERCTITVCNITYNSRVPRFDGANSSLSCSVIILLRFSQSDCRTIAPI